MTANVPWHRIDGIWYEIELAANRSCRRRQNAAMTHRPALDFLPRPAWLLVGIYTFASIVHFAHNAEFIAMYPNMPAWTTREHVYVAWLAVAALSALIASVAVESWAAIP